MKCNGYLALVSIILIIGILTLVYYKNMKDNNIEDNRIIQQEINKQSALNKLKALGLNDAEIKAIIGI